MNYKTRPIFAFALFHVHQLLLFYMRNSLLTSISHLYGPTFIAAHVLLLQDIFYFMESKRDDWTKVYDTWRAINTEQMHVNQQQDADGWLGI